MNKIRIFLASSDELKSDRNLFEIEIYRKCKAWYDKGIFLHLDIWEDLSARMSYDGSQSEYNKYVHSADVFVLLACTKLGMYTCEEFEKAFGKFTETKKPFIFTYFKSSSHGAIEESLTKFQQKLHDLGHFYCAYEDSNDLWNQFNKELERLEAESFTRYLISQANLSNQVYQNAEKIFNIGKIENANFS
jgi:hypothetical protein